MPVKWVALPWKVLGFVSVAGATFIKARWRQMLYHSPHLACSCVYVMESVSVVTTPEIVVGQTCDDEDVKCHGLVVRPLLVDGGHCLTSVRWEHYFPQPVSCGVLMHANLSHFRLQSS